jgi:multiple sugar transport system substrate-binding protein
MTNGTNIWTLARRHLLKGSAAGVAATALPAPLVAQPKELRFLNAEPAIDSVRALRVAAAQYEREKGVKVTIDTVPSIDAYTRTVAAIRGGRPYDIHMIIFVAHMLTLAREGHLVPVSSVVNKYRWGPKILYPIDGETWWYPYDYNFCWLYYRRDLYDQLRLAPAKTWAEYLENSRKCMTEGAARRFGHTTPIGSNDATNWMTFGFMWAEGVSLFDDRWNLTFDTPAMRAKTAAYLDFFAELYKTMPPGSSQFGFVQAMAQFGANQAAHAPYAGRMIEYLEQRHPDMADKYGMMPYPDSTGSAQAINHGYDGILVGKTAMSEESLKFLEWWSDAHYINFLHSAPLHFQPPRLDVYDDPRWLAHPLIEKHKAAVDMSRAFLNDDKLIIRSIDTEGPAPDLRPAKIFQAHALPEMIQNKVLRNMSSAECVEGAVQAMKRAIA